MSLPDTDEAVSERCSEVWSVGVLTEIDAEAFGLLDCVFELQSL
jgi:hypothetical protein